MNSSGPLCREAERVPFFSACLAASATEPTRPAGMGWRVGNGTRLPAASKSSTQQPSCFSSSARIERRPSGRRAAREMARWALSDHSTRASCSRESSAEMKRMIAMNGVRFDTSSNGIPARSQAPIRRGGICGWITAVAKPRAPDAEGGEPLDVGVVVLLRAGTLRELRTIGEQ